MHKANLINSGIIPLTFKNSDDYERINEGDSLELKDISSSIREQHTAVLINKTTNETIELEIDLSERARDILLAGGMLNYTANN